LAGYALDCAVKEVFAVDCNWVDVRQGRVCTSGDRAAGEVSAITKRQGRDQTFVTVLQGRCLHFALLSFCMVLQMFVLELDLCGRGGALWVGVLQLHPLNCRGGIALHLACLCCAAGYRCFLLNLGSCVAGQVFALDFGLCGRGGPALWVAVQYSLGCMFHRSLCEATDFWASWICKGICNPAM
jgi:hypothetical protein